MFSLTLSHLERIELCFFCMCRVELWKIWVRSQPGPTLAENFLENSTVGHLFKACQHLVMGVVVHRDYWPNNACKPWRSGEN